MDWLDILLHLGITVASFFAVGIFTRNTEYYNPAIVGTMLLNMVGWPVREIIQHSDNVTHIFTGPQSLAEWGLPLIASIVLAYVFYDDLTYDGFETTPFDSNNSGQGE